MAELRSKETPETDAVWVSIGVTKNLGNYESLRIDAGTRHVIQNGEFREVVWQEAWDDVQAQIEAQLLEVAKGMDD